MDGPTETSNSPAYLPTPRASLKNLGEKKEDEDGSRTNHNFKAFGADGLTFFDLLDIINPLQHVPIVGNLYREMTGDNIEPGSRIAGSTLFGGPLGTVVAMANVVVEEKTGQDIGDHVIALIDGKRVSNDATKLDDKEIHLTKPENLDEAISPIKTNLEVLEWAKHEIAYSLNAEKVQLSKNFQETEELFQPIKNPTAEIYRSTWTHQETRIQKPSIKQITENSDSKISEHIKFDQSKINSQMNTPTELNSDQPNNMIAKPERWLSETILFALARYDESTQLVKNQKEKRTTEKFDNRD